MQVNPFRGDGLVESPCMIGMATAFARSDSRVTGKSCHRAHSVCYADPGQINGIYVDISSNYTTVLLAFSNYCLQILNAVRCLWRGQNGTRGVGSGQRRWKRRRPTNIDGRCLFESSSFVVRYLHFTSPGTVRGMAGPQPVSYRPFAFILEQVLPCCRSSLESRPSRLFSRNSTQGAPPHVVAFGSRPP